MRIPPDWWTWDVDLPRNDVNTFPEEILNKAVAACVDSLREALGPGRRVCVIVDDFSRSTPTPEILARLLPELTRFGIRDSEVFFVFASGSHRLMTPEEKKQRLGPGIYGRYRSLDHRFFDTSELKTLGRFEDGAPIMINRHVIEADIRIAVGTLVPHMPAGFSGGAKMLLPGVAGEATVHHMHMTGAQDPDQAIGVADTGPRRLMEEMAAKVAPFSIINAILDSRSRPVAFAGGRYDTAFRQGVELAKGVYYVGIPGLADVVVADARGHDADMTQAHKALFSAVRAVKPGGDILLVTDCPEGVSPTHGKEMLAFGTRTNPEVTRAVISGEMKDPLAAIEILHANRVRESAKTYIHCPNITPAEAAQMNLGHVVDAEKFLRDRREQGRTLGLLRSATYIVPEIR